MKYATIKYSKYVSPLGPRPPPLSPRHHSKIHINIKSFVTLYNLLFIELHNVASSSYSRL